MKKSIMKKWVAALRSGDYKKGVGRLRVNAGKKTSFCCLGVLCNLHALAHPKIAKEQTDPNYYMNHTGTLPPAVAEWAGMKSREGALPEPVWCNGALCDALTCLNDLGKAPFKKIADVIEEQYATL